MTKVCKNCNLEKSFEEYYQFYDKYADRKYFSSRCKPCHQEYKKNNPSTPRNRKSEKLQLRYGLSYDQWETMREKENYRCMICSISEDELGRKLDVDHCHKSGKVRGLLCNQCNTMLGHAKDNLSILEAAVKYLRDNAEGYK